MMTSPPKSRDCLIVRRSRPSQGDGAVLERHGYRCQRRHGGVAYEVLEAEEADSLRSISLADDGGWRCTSRSSFAGASRAHRDLTGDAEAEEVRTWLSSSLHRDPQAVQPAAGDGMGRAAAAARSLQGR